MKALELKIKNGVEIDELKADVIVWNDKFPDNKGNTFYLEQKGINLKDEAFDAIPVDWIKKWGLDANKQYEVASMLKAWRVEELLRKGIK